MTTNPPSMIAHIDEALSLVHARVKEEYGKNASGFAVSEFSLSGMTNYLAYPVQGSTPLHNQNPSAPEGSTLVASEMAVILGESFLRNASTVTANPEGTVYYFARP